MSTKLSRYTEGIMEAAWLAAVIVVPVFFDIYSSRIFEPDKITLLRTLGLVILAAWLIKLLEEGGVRWQRLERGNNWWQTLRSIPMILPVAALVLVYLIATVFSVSTRVSWWGSYQRLQGTYTTFSYLVVFLSMAANLRRREQVQRLITVVVLSSLPVSLYGLLQRFQLDPIPWKSGWWRYRMPGLGSINWGRFVSTLQESGYNYVLSIEHEDPVWEGSEEKVKTGLKLGLKHLSQFVTD